MSSGLAWLSSSSAEIARARAVLKALTPGGVIDELGFLVLQGAFADHFYPAVTTPMTRARYLIFIPALYRYLEKSGKAVGKDVDRLSRDLHYALLQALLKNETNAIGMDSGRNIVRTPSEIYWNALGTLGISTQLLSESSYQRKLSGGAFGARRLKDDDGVAHDEESESLWNGSTPLSNVVADGEFPSGTDFRLRKLEARFLRAQYADVKPAGRESLLTHLITLATERGADDLVEIKHLWDIPALPGQTAAEADHARRLSLFARGTTLQYHRMLIEKKKLTDSGAGEAFVSWWAHAREDLATWDTDAFFGLIKRWGADRRPKQDREFIGGWIARCVVAKSASQALDDVDARRIIAAREANVRRGKERLRVKYQLDSWRMPASYPVNVFHQLGYRHNVGRQFAEDIAKGLGGEP
jgi:hypothetical protein